MSQEANPLINEKLTYKSPLKIKLIVLNICLSSFYFGYSMICFGQIEIDTLKDIFDIELNAGTALGILMGVPSIGGLLGALSTSILITKFSRRNALLFVNALAFLFGSLIFIEYFPLLLFVRFCLGFCGGFKTAIIPLFVKELSPIEISGTLGAYNQLFSVFGLFFGSIFAYSLKKYTGDNSGHQFWRILFGFPLVIIAIQSIVLLFVFPYETPKYLLSIGQEQQAKKLIQVIYKEEYVDEILEQKKNDLQITTSQAPRRHDTTVVESSVSTQQMASSPNLKITSIIAIHLRIMESFSGFGTIVMYAIPIIQKASQGQLVLLITSIITFELVLATFVTSFLLAKYGRRTILLVGGLLSGVACGLVTYGFFIKDSDPYDLIFINGGIIFFTAVFGLSILPVVSLYIPEIVQPKIVSYTTGVSTLTGALIIFLFPIIKDDFFNGNPAPIFMFFTVWSLGSFIFNYFYVLETKDKTEKMIRSEYANKKICR